MRLARLPASVAASLEMTAPDAPILVVQGLNLPEVSLVCILDADAEGFLRSDTALLQTIGRATRHEAGRAVLYADRVTPSMKRALAETDRRRAIQTR